jgi:hypothetical protein
MADDDVAKALKRRRQISITVTGRRTGREITIPVWFVYGDGALWLLPVYGSDTQWYRNLMKTALSEFMRENFARSFAQGL